jgi:hypothetical protein
MLDTTALVSSSFSYIVMSMYCCLLCVLIIRQKQRKAYLKSVKKKTDDLLRAENELNKQKGNVPPRPVVTEQKLPSSGVVGVLGKGKLYIASDPYGLHDKVHQVEKHGKRLGKCVAFQEQPRFTDMYLTDDASKCVDFEKIGFGSFSYKDKGKHTISTSPYYMRDTKTGKCLYTRTGSSRGSWWGDCPAEDGKPVFTDDRQRQLSVFEDEGQIMWKLPVLPIENVNQSKGCMGGNDIFGIASKNNTSPKEYVVVKKDKPWSWYTFAINSNHSQTNVDKRTIPSKDQCQRWSFK